MCCRNSTPSNFDEEVDVVDGWFQFLDFEVGGFGWLSSTEWLYLLEIKEVVNHPSLSVPFWDSDAIEANSSHESLGSPPKARNRLKTVALPSGGDGRHLEVLDLSENQLLEIQERPINMAVVLKRKHQHCSILLDGCPAVGCNQHPHRMPFPNGRDITTERQAWQLLWVGEKGLGWFPSRRLNIWTSYII